MRTFLLVAILAGASGCKDKAAGESGTGETAEPQFAMMSLDEVDTAVAANTVTPVDCNGDRTRHKLGVVPTAILISDEEAFTSTELPADKTRRLVFYCADTH